MSITRAQKGKVRDTAAARRSYAASLSYACPVWTYAAGGHSRPPPWLQRQGGSETQAGIMRSTVRTSDHTLEANLAHKLYSSHGTAMWGYNAHKDLA